METKDVLNRISILIEEITDIHIRIRTEIENIKEIDLELMKYKSIELYDHIQKLKQLDIINSQIEYTVQEKLPELEKLDKKESTEKIKTADTETKEDSQKSEVETNIEFKNEHHQTNLFEREEKIKSQNDDNEKDYGNEIKEDYINENVTEKESLNTKTDPQTHENNSEKEDQSRTKDKDVSERTSLNERYSGVHTISLNDKFSKENMNRVLADKLKLTHVSDLKSAISINQQAAFIEQLFKGNKKEYKRSIEFLNKCGNYSEAKFYINSELSGKYQWNAENKLVGELVELVYRRFL